MDLMVDGGDVCWCVDLLLSVAAERLFSGLCALIKSYLDKIIVIKIIIREIYLVDVNIV